ncbi:transcription factor EC isoform X2 [Hippocampus comes]|uniref:transcription factor EC isoform X2 n=1 Tax=Hippocampus comes TaxID=109280 RepID=UPI00094EA9FE|nr:PREDICTED: transcription factor EC isoform X2 [Hippocampus comes]
MSVTFFFVEACTTSNGSCLAAREQKKKKERPNKGSGCHGDNLAECAEFSAGRKSVAVCTQKQLISMSLARTQAQPPSLVLLLSGFSSNIHKRARARRGRSGPFSSPNKLMCHAFVSSLIFLQSSGRRLRVLVFFFLFSLSPAKPREIGSLPRFALFQPPAMGESAGAMSRRCVVKVVTLTEIQLLQVQSQLENTKFHLHQSQQVKQYLTLGSKLASSTAHPHGPGQPLPTVPVMRNVDDPNSPGALMAMANHDSEFPMDEVIDDLISLESGFKDGGLDCMESNILMQNNVSLSSSMLDVYGGEQEHDTRVMAKERQKKDNHNLIERRRRYNINYRIKELGTLIPKSNDPDMRWNKGTILKASVEYIRWLQKEQQHARELESRQKKLEQANRRLILRIQELEIQARAHGLPNLATSLVTTELNSHLLKQQQSSPHAPQPPQPPLYQEDPNADYLQRISAGGAGAPTAPAPSGPQDHAAGADGCAAFSDPLSHFTEIFSATLKGEHRLDQILMDEALSPFGADPLLSSGSPRATSKGSSRRSSFSSGEGDDL